VDKIIGNHQCGLRRNRSSTDLVFCIRQILEKNWEYNETVHQLFVDFKKTYDSVGREVLYSMVNRRLPTSAAHVRARVRSCGIYGGESGTGADFLRVLRFPLPTFIPPIAPQSASLSIMWGWCNKLIVATVPSGLSLTPLIIIIIIVQYSHRVSGAHETSYAN
jgi:hypothetical protein